MKNILIFLTCLISFSAFAQSDTTDLNTLINASMPDNTSGAITPEDLRNVSRGLMRSNANKLERNVFAESVEVSDSVKTTAGFYRWNGSSWVEVGGAVVSSEWKVSSEITTVIATVDIPVQLDGKTDYSNEELFTGASADNAAKYIGSETVKVFAIAVISLSGGSGDDATVIVRQYDDSVAGYIDLNTTTPITLASGEAHNIVVTALATMDDQDRIELWVANNTDADNITMLLDSHFVITKVAG